MRRVLTLAALSLGLGTSAQATLMVSVFGDPTEDVIAVEFSGSAVNTGGSATFSPSGNQGWYDVGEYFSGIGPVVLNPFAGSASMTKTGGPTRAIDAVVFDEDKSTNGDDFLISIEGEPGPNNDEVPIAANDEISWMGTLYFLANIDDVYSGDGIMQFSASNFSDDAVFDLSISFDDGMSAGVSPVPLPGALPLALLGLGALGFASRRRKS